MADHAVSDDLAVQHQLDRLWSLSPGTDILGLDRITELLARLGDPQRRLPPVLHVAGTNGKGSTCAFLRAALEATGLRVHVYTSPHLVRFNERIRLAGTLIDDRALAALLGDVIDRSGDLGASFFEVTTAAALLGFARTAADACIIEVGLGGRLDATNVVAAPLTTGIAQLGIDHQAFLGDDPVAIAGEKAGIAKPDVPLVTMAYPPAVAARVAAVASAAGARLIVEGEHWSFANAGGRLRYEDSHGALDLPLPKLVGSHQAGNFALATAMLRHQSQWSIRAAAFGEAAHSVSWPARMQRLAPGPLTTLLPVGSELWLDGGHNAGAAAAISAALATRANARPVHLILGMLANKDAAALLGAFVPHLTTLVAVPVEGHEHHDPAAIAALARGSGVDGFVAADVAAALTIIAAAADRPVVTLILGSLYLAGSALAANGEIPA